ncbi:hypothetical protein Tco_1227894 [Tanacetum coccineum]
MAIYVIPISTDSSEESVGMSTTRVILFGTIPTAISATVPIVDPLIVHDDTPLIPTETPTISCVIMQCTRSDVVSLAHIRRVFLDGYSVLDVRTIFFKCLRLSSTLRAF